MKKLFPILAIALIAAAVSSYSITPIPQSAPQVTSQQTTPFPSSEVMSTDKSSFVKSLPSLIDPSIIYDPSYIQLSYPDGDVAAHTGVCSDVVIRAFKNVGVSLQQEIYEFRKSSNLSTDKHIDHRRVRNLGPYFKSLGLEIETTEFLPGDIIWWILPSGLDHIGIVMPNGRVLHNIGNGQVADVSPTTFQVHKVYRLMSR